MRRLLFIGAALGSIFLLSAATTQAQAWGGCCRPSFSYGCYGGYGGGYAHGCYGGGYAAHGCYGGYSYGGYGHGHAYGGYRFSGYASYPMTYSTPYVYGSTYSSSPYFAADTTYSTSANGSQSVLLRVNVPTPEAQLWIEGQPTQARGTMRTFQSPALESGHNYTYTIRAQWMQDGQEVSREFQIDVQPGEDKFVNVARQGSAEEAAEEGTQQPRRQDQQRFQNQDPANRDLNQPRSNDQLQGGRGAAEQGRIWGTVRSIDADQGQITLSTLDGPRTFEMAQDAEVRFQGESGDLGMLLVGDDVTVAADQGGERVSNIRIETRYQDGERVRPQQ